MKKLYNFFFSYLSIAAVVFFMPNKSFGTVYTIDIALSGNQEVPANSSTGLGSLTGTYDDVTNTLSFNVVFTGLLSPTTAAHFHAPAAKGINAPVLIGFAGFPVGVLSGSYSNSYVLTPAQETQLLTGQWYVNIHTSASPGGEIRGQLQEAPPMSFDLTLYGSQEVPPNPSTGLGNLTGTYNDATNTLSFNVVFTGLLSPTTAAHFHSPAAKGVNAPVVIGFAGFPVGVLSGSYSNSYVLTSAQEIDLLAGRWYVNIHTSASPGGEIRGQLEEGTLPGFVALPVNLTDVRAYQKNAGVQVEWTAHQEVNIERYEVQRSQDGQQFIKAGTVEAKGNNSILMNYNFFDNAPLSGVNFYRIKIIEAAQVIYSKIVKVNISNSSVNRISIYPNPIKGNSIALSMNLQKGSYTISLTDNIGQQILTKVINHPGGTATQNIMTMKALADGIYQLRLKGEGINIVRQVIKN